MFNSLPMVLIADRDSFSNATLSHELRKLGLAGSVICTTTASNALAYLHKQQICSYPFPDFIIYNPSNLDVDATEFINSFKLAFTNQYKSKFILIREKNHEANHSLYRDEVLVVGGICKPVSTEQLLRMFKSKVKNQVHIK
ncbi:MAG: response regulator RpfG family c-di-GMP phosphodiesterase [Cryomorphaceae bacterium]|jgi:response regulator RpfG family c-di-GMP phosphodiesterase